MSQPGMPPDWDELRREMRAFERRIARIEERLELPSAAPPPVPIQPAAPEVSRVALAEGASAIPVLGRALLGLAGAYVLRALTESRALPQQAGVVAGMIYAILWLLWAARTPTGRRVEAALYSLTSALVLGPLLWESTIRFRAISTWTAAAVLFLFTVFGLVISWRKNLLLVATIATLTGVLTAAALLIGSHDVMPFTFLSAGYRRRGRSIRVSRSLAQRTLANGGCGGSRGAAGNISGNECPRPSRGLRCRFRMPPFSRRRWPCWSSIWQARLYAHCSADSPSPVLKRHSSGWRSCWQWVAACA